MRFTVSEVLRAWIVATLFSGIPSTVYALAAGHDILEATRAAGAMLVASDSTPRLIAAAVIVHASVSLFWAFAVSAVLPRRHTFAWALVASALIAVLDLRVIAPAFFPQAAALAFWPQFADHLMWGACLGLTLGVRRRRGTPKPSDVR
jgi:hypothetical protein